MPKGLDRTDLNSGSGGSVSGGGNYLNGTKIGNTPINVGKSNMSTSHNFGNVINWNPSAAHFGNIISWNPSAGHFGNVNPKNNPASAIGQIFTQTQAPAPASFLSAQRAANNGNASSTGTNSVTLNTLGATLIVVCVYWFNAGGLVTPTISDGMNFNWTLIGANHTVAGGGVCMFASLNPVTSSSHTITTTGQPFLQITGTAFSGTFLGFNADTINSVAGASPYTVGSVNTNSKDLVFSTVVTSAGSKTFSTASVAGYSSVPFSSGDAMASAYSTSVNAGTASPVWTYTGTSGALAIGLNASFSLATANVGIPGVALVQQTNNGLAFAATAQPSLTLPSPVTRGNLLVAWAASASPAFQVISDDHNNWIQICNKYAEGYGFIAVWYAVAQLSESVTIKMFDANPFPSGGFGSTPSNFSTVNAQFMEFSGTSTNPFESVSLTNGTGTALSGTVSPTNPYSLIWSVGIGSNTNATRIGAGFNDPTGGSHPISSAQYQVGTAATQYNVGMSLPSSGPWGLVSAVFRPVGSSNNAISGSVGSAGSGATVFVVSTSSTFVQTVTADSAGNFSITLPNDTYLIQPEVVGQTFAPLFEVVALAGANVTGVNFTPTVASTTLTLTPVVTDTFIRANESPLNNTNWTLDGIPVPPFDPGMAVVNNQCVTANATVFANYAGPYCGDGIQTNKATLTANQYVSVKISSINASQGSYAAARLMLKTSATSDTGVLVDIYNNGNGTVSLNALGFLSGGQGIPFPGFGNFIPPSLGNKLVKPGPWMMKNIPFSINDTFTLAVKGTTWYVLHNGTVIGNWIDASTYSTQAGLSMVGTSQTDVIFTNFVGGNVT